MMHFKALCELFKYLRGDERVLKSYDPSMEVVKAYRIPELIKKGK